MFKLQICDADWVYSGSDTTGRDIYNWALELAKDSLVEDNYLSERHIVISDDSLKKVFKESKFSGCGLAVISMQGFACDKSEVTFKFDSVEEAEKFKSWMCNSGEQQFFDIDDDGREVYYGFEYHDPGGSVVIVKKYD